MTQVPQDQLATTPEAGHQAHDPSLRTVDLGREQHLVTWQEWFGRTAQLMAMSVSEEQRQHLHFRVTLETGQVFAIRRVMTHVAKGACYPDRSRWSAAEIAGAATLPTAAGSTKVVGSKAVCNVITGYMLQGYGPDMKPTTLSVTPCQIASVECVLSEPQHSGEPFGFAAFHHMKETPEMEEVEETVPLPADPGIMPPTFTGPGLSVETAPGDQS
ncbi:MAG: hypothetical protein Tsb0013_13250 [Phycisphaerales bacterium]